MKPSRHYGQASTNRPACCIADTLERQLRVKQRLEVYGGRPLIGNVTWPAGVSESDFKALTNAVLWAAWLWPPIAIGVAGILLRSRLRSAVVFVTFGVLASFGVYWLVGALSLGARVNYLAKSVDDQIMLAVVGFALATLIVSVAISLPLLYWLYRALRKDP